MRDWSSKLDTTLKETVARGGSRAADWVDCIIRLDEDPSNEMVGLVDSVGGSIRYRIGAVPGLVVSLPISALRRIASNKHVVQIEAERIHTVH